MERHPLTLTVNGKRYDVETEHRKTLADTLREDCGLTGTHVGCEHGVCGACTVVIDGKSMRSCLIFAHQAEETEIETVEGLEKDGELHVLQECFMEHHALQCGYCTPGFLMLVKGAVESGEDLTDDELRHLLSSNLCRCTGYQNIVTAVRAAITTVRQNAPKTAEVIA